MASTVESKTVLGLPTDIMWDSPIGGAYLIWRFVRGYQQINEAGPNVLLLYPAIAIVLNRRLAKEISHSWSLVDFAYAFQDSSGKNTKTLTGLHEQICNQKGWVLKSIEFALVTRLVELNPSTGLVSAVLQSENPTSRTTARKFKDSDGLKAELLGKMFANTKEGSIAYYLGVKF